MTQSSPAAVSQPALIWDIGTGYDLFASLYVLHNPSEFALRAAWAAGVRSRLGQEAREFLQNIVSYLSAPLEWVYGLPKPKDSLTVVRELEKLDDEDVLTTLFLAGDCSDVTSEVYRRILNTGSWNEEDMRELMACAEKHQTCYQANRESIAVFLDWCTKRQEFGKRYKQVIAEYYESFFREEERRITPDIERAYASAREMAQKLPTASLFEELTRGLSGESYLKHKSVVLVPSFWAAPRVFCGMIGPDESILVFGARPNDASLVPGQPVPDDLYIALQALGDQTRLRILRLLSDRPLTQTEIAKKLRLRTPTIGHHMKGLRIAGLITISQCDGDQTRYATRFSRVADTCEALREFLSDQEQDNSKNGP